MIARTLRALMEYGSYGPSLNGTGGVSAPLGTGRGMLAPFLLDPEHEKDRIEAMMRRRRRLGELAREWARPGEAYGDGNKNGRGKKSKSKKAARVQNQPARVFATTQ